MATRRRLNQGGAVRVPEFSLAEPLRPPPEPRPVYVPGRVDKPSQHMEAISSFLGNFANTVGRWEDDREAEMEKERKEQEEREKERALGEWYTYSHDDKREALRTGDLPQGLGAMEAEATYGAAEANRFLQRQLPEVLREWDTTPDLQDEFESKSEYVRSRRNEHAGSLDGDARMVFLHGTEDSLVKNFDPAVAEENHKQEQLGRINNSSDALRLIYDRMSGEGATGEEIVGELHDAVNTSTAFKNVTGPEANHILLQMAREAADRGDPDLVVALRDTERVGPDGQPIQLGRITASSLDGKTNFVEEFDTLLVQSEKTKVANDQIKDVASRDEAATMAERGELTEDYIKQQLAARGEDRAAHWRGFYADMLLRSEENKRKLRTQRQQLDAHQEGHRSVLDEVETHLRDGTLDSIMQEEWTIPADKPGNKPKTLTGKEMAKTALRAYEARIEEGAQGALERIQNDPNMDPQERQEAQAAIQQEVFNTKINMYARNQVVNERWKQQLKGVSMEMTTAQAHSGEIPEDVQAAADLYTRLYETSGGALNNYVTNDADRVFFEEYRMGRMAGRNAQTALANAARGVEAHAQGGNAFTSVSSSNIEEYLSENIEEFYEAPGWFAEGEEAMVFADTDKSEFRDMASWAMRHLPSVAGDPEAAMDYAKEWFQKNYVNINGKPVYSGAEGTPGDFKEQVTSYLSEFYEANAEELKYQGVEAPEDLVLERRGNGYGEWVVYSKNHALPISEPTADGLPSGRPLSVDFPVLAQHRDDVSNRQLEQDFESAQEERQHLQEQEDKRDRIREQMMTPPKREEFETQSSFDKARRAHQRRMEEEFDNTPPDMGDPMDPEGYERDREPMFDPETWGDEVSNAREVLQSNHLVEGKESSHVDKMDGEFAVQLAAAMSDPMMPQGVRIFSGARSKAHQKKLWNAALKKYGSEAEARKWVAPPGKSQHNHGKAADLLYNGVRLDKVDERTRRAIHNVMKEHGLHFPLDNEPWHVEHPSGRTQAGGTPQETGKPDFSDPRDILIRTVIGEAEGEGPEGWAAVAHTINNRTQDERWADSPMLVALQSKQFSVWNKDKRNSHRGARVSPNSSLYKRVGKVVDEVLNGERIDPTLGATHYLAPNSLSRLPSWFNEERQRHRTGKGIRIGNHTFVGLVNNQ